MISPMRSATKAKLEQYFAFIGMKWKTEMKLNEEGVCAFRRGRFAIAIDFSSDASNFLVYTCLFKLSSSTSATPLLKKALELNFLNQETRGCTIALDPTVSDDSTDMEMTLCRSHPMEGLDCLRLYNLLKAFSDTAVYLHRQLNHAESSELEMDDASLSSGAPPPLPTPPKLLPFSAAEAPTPTISNKTPGRGVKRSTPSFQSVNERRIARVSPIVYSRPLDRSDGTKMLFPRDQTTPFASSKNRRNLSTTPMSDQPPAPSRKKPSLVSASRTFTAAYQLPRDSHGCNPAESFLVSPLTVPSAAPPRRKLNRTRVPKHSIERHSFGIEVSARKGMPRVDSSRSLTTFPACDPNFEISVAPDSLPNPTQEEEPKKKRNAFRRLSCLTARRMPRHRRQKKKMAKAPDHVILSI